MEQPLKRRLEALLPCADEPASLTLDEADQRELHAFIHGHRELGASRLPLNRLDRMTASVARHWDACDEQLWREAVVDGADWETLRCKAIIDGKRQGLDRLRLLARQRLEAVAASGL